MLKLFSSFYTVRFILLKILPEWVLNCYILCPFRILTMIYTIVRVEAAGAGAASRYGSGSDQMMRLRLRLRNTGTEA
jgi:hypothetical protein